MTITAEQLKAAVAEYYEEDVASISGDTIAEMRDSAGTNWRTKEKGVELPNVGLVEVEDEWGGEGQGDEIGFVLKVADQYFMFSGNWVSHDGAYWDYSEFIEVEPKVVPKTIWV